MTPINGFRGFPGRLDKTTGGQALLGILILAVPTAITALVVSLILAVKDLLG